MVDLAIAIVNYNTVELTAKCVESVDAATHRITYEVAIVDNCSRDDSVRLLRGRFPEVAVIENRVNVGFAKATNQAICTGEARYVLLLNSDTIVRTGALDRLVALMDEREDVGLAGCKLVNADGSLQPSCEKFPSLRVIANRVLFGQVGCAYPVDCYERPFEPELLKGACIMARKRALDEVGLLDERFFIYHEDYDLCLRMQRAGWRIAYLPEAVVVHYGGKSTEQVSWQMTWHFWKSLGQLHRKHRGFLSALGVAALRTLAYSKYFAYRFSATLQRSDVRSAA